MRLNKIKLVGFKSFVDPTLVLLQSNLTAIVGPNGCGKSNIVDAVRWVIGESSAKQLRGESLADVIFNGTIHRKPVGKASIELIFDNTQGRLNAAYAAYNEISIKREITRDGQSGFYLNGVKCRKRDITDLFLGTGLGPSSYAIIEQGVISQLIESKPEELRIHFEEAAGISRYRERRKETESRIKSTRENLERLTDVREEIQKQLERLKRQASAAERFKIFKKEQRLFKAQLHTLQSQSLEHQLAQQHQLLSIQTTLLEENIAEQRTIELNIEQGRVQHTEANEGFSQVQQTFYSLGTDIATKEQHIHNIQHNSEQLSNDIKRLENSQQEIELNQEEDSLKVEELSADLTLMIPQSEEAEEMADETQLALEQAEADKKTSQDQWHHFQKALSEIQQKTKLEATREQHLSQKLLSIETRVARLQQEHQTLGSETLVIEIDQLTDESAKIHMEMDELQQLIAQTNEYIRTQRQKNLQDQTSHDQIKQAIQKLHHQKVSLDALQQAAIKKHDAGTDQWLKENGWSEKPRLIESLEVENGWETAIETAIAPYIEAICTDNIEDYNLVASHISKGRLTLFNMQKTTTATVAHQAKALASKVIAPVAVHSLLKGIYVAENTVDALSMLSDLNSDESVMTREGIWFSPCWIRINKVQDETVGVLQRKQSLQDIAKSILSQESILEVQYEKLQAGQQLFVEAEDARDRQQSDYRELSILHSELRSRLSAKKAEFDQIQKRNKVLTQDLDEQKQQLSETQNQLVIAQNSAQQAQSEYEAQDRNKLSLMQSQEAERIKVDHLREKARAFKKTADEYQVRVSSTQNQLHYLQQNIERTHKQFSQLKVQYDALQERRNLLLAPLVDLQHELQLVLNKRLSIEKELNQMREQVQQTNHVLENLDKQRHYQEQQAHAIREMLEKIRIEQGSLNIRLENHLQQIGETGHTFEVLKQEMPEEAAETVWQEKVAEVDRRIQRLGPINLAAIEEYEELSQRKNYLDSQDEDLCEALSMLENTIQKIDKESRVRLRETFEQANQNFKTLFSQMFNGGNAELEFTGDEVLSAGIIIRAQPPGKRNTQLYLLSGGEKALTAIALVFALFQLNPAPFCILDEVDAPLDDANVSRFCRLVQIMSETVQFLFISHNKVTMEMARQLIGVTMREPGASRLVSVDIEEAIALTEA